MSVFEIRYTRDIKIGGGYIGPCKEYVAGTSIGDAVSRLVKWERKSSKGRCIGCNVNSITRLGDVRI